MMPSALTPASLTNGNARPPMSIYHTEKHTQLVFYSVLKIFYVHCVI